MPLIPSTYKKKKARSGFQIEFQSSKQSQWRVVDLFSSSFWLRFFPSQPIYRRLELLPETTSSYSIARRGSLIISLSLSNGPEPTAVELAIAAPKTLAVEGTFICFFDFVSIISLLKILCVLLLTARTLQLNSPSVSYILFQFYFQFEKSTFVYVCLSLIFWLLLLL